MWLLWWTRGSALLAWPLCWCSDPRQTAVHDVLLGVLLGLRRIAQLDCVLGQSFTRQVGYPCLISVAWRFDAFEPYKNTLLLLSRHRVPQKKRGKAAGRFQLRRVCCSLKDIVDSFSHGVGRNQHSEHRRVERSISNTAKGRQGTLRCLHTMHQGIQDRFVLLLDVCAEKWRYCDGWSR